ncbi:MAG: hypothetical protein IPJ04_04265 [Candidatus Eisenbacteria bacterium]|nr:hypothetical protein [Candidatus Eisenbacteria bacterium]
MRVLLRSLQAALALFGATAAHADPLAESLGEGVVRWWADAPSRDSAPVSVMLAEPRAGKPITQGGPIAPRFLLQGGGLVVRLDVPRGTTLHGTGEVGGPLVRNGRQVTCWNTDAYAYSSTSPSLYQSHPWVLGVRADGTASACWPTRPSASRSTSRAASSSARRARPSR